MPPTTTMKRIAGELGVSITTVSKVLNNRDDIGHATRARVLAKVAELGYQPNAVARSLTLRRTHTLGVVIPDLMHSFFVEIVAGLEAVASARGYGLLLCSSNEDPVKERQELEMLRQRQVDGIVLGSANASGNTDLLQQLTSLGIGLVMIDRDDHPDVRCDRVVTDDEEVGRLATAHLIAQGRRAIAHITGTSVVHAKRRAEGYRAALKAAGIKPKPEWIVRGGFKEVRRLPRDEEAARDAAAHRRRVRRERSVGDRRDEGDLGRRAARAGRHRGRRRRGHRARRSPARAADHRQLVARGPGQGGGGAAARAHRRRRGRRRRRPQRVVIPPKLVVRRSSGGE